MDLGSLHYTPLAIIHCGIHELRLFEEASFTAFQTMLESPLLSSIRLQ